MHVCILFYSLYIRFIFCLVVFFYYHAIYTVYKPLKCLVYICSFEVTCSLFQEGHVKTGLILFCCEYVYFISPCELILSCLRYIIFAVALIGHRNSAAILLTKRNNSLKNLSSAEERDVQIINFLHV